MPCSGSINTILTDLGLTPVASMLYLDYGKKDGEWIPNRWGGKENVDAIEFMRQLNSTVFQYFPGVMMIAEESTAWAFSNQTSLHRWSGFSYKWNMGWMNDFLRYMSMDSVYRKYHQNLITFSLMYAFSENFILVLSHDEVVHGKCSMINKMPEITGKSLRACVQATVTCTAIPARNFFSWGENLHSLLNGTTSKALTGSCWIMTCIRNAGLCTGPQQALQKRKSTV